jgi:hypothetical protein
LTKTWTQSAASSSSCTGNYFPRKIAGSRDLKHDPSVPAVDEKDYQLLKNVRVYTLAETLSLPTLRSLASSKIHCVNSTAKGEIAYACYVYAHTHKNVPPSVPLSPTSGPRVATPCAPRPRTSSDRCAWSSRSSDAMFLVSRMEEMVTRITARVLDEKFKREEREATSSTLQLPKTTPRHLDPFRFVCHKLATGSSLLGFQFLGHFSRQHLLIHGLLSFSIRITVGIC